MGHHYTLVDAFSRTPLMGNPVAVFFDTDDLDASTMQRIAMEMHLSEVTFVGDVKPNHSVKIRIFTPVNELPFAGHPLIGTARAFFDRNRVATAIFGTAVGPIRMWRTSDEGTDTEISMNQPVPSLSTFDEGGLVFDALALQESYVPIELFTNGPRHLLVGLATRGELRRLRPNHLLLARLADLAINCFAVEDGVIYNRMFSPAYGVQEDAGTGSAAGPLAIHCLRHKLVEEGKDILIEQGHALGKRCLMTVRLRGVPESIQEVVVSGETAVVAEGFIVI